MIVLAAVLIYIGFVVVNRWWDQRAFDAREAAREKAGRLPPELATSELKVLQFYGSPPLVAAGEQALLCYGVLNATKVRVEPGAIELGPSLSRCFQVAPKRTTEYTLTASDARGRQQTAAVTLTVR